MKYDYKKLRAAREKMLMTQQELAKLAGFSVTTVYMVETGRAPWKKAIRRIAALLSVKNVVLAGSSTNGFHGSRRATR